MLCCSQFYIELVCLLEYVVQSSLFSRSEATQLVNKSGPKCKQPFENITHRDCLSLRDFSSYKQITFTVVILFIFVKNLVITLLVSGSITMARRQSNNQWSGGIAAHPAPKYSDYKIPLEKFLPRFFWDQDGILLIDFLPKGQTINAEYYSFLLVQLKDILK